MRPIEVPHQYGELSETIEEYKHNLVNRFRNRQQTLINELQQQAIFLKKQIAFYSEETSKQNIDSLIAKKRAEKEAERLTLEVKWRQLTAKLKKLEQEEKKLIDSNKQAQFDLHNFKQKIDQLRIANTATQHRITNLKSKRDDLPFITEAKQEYVSPYKCQRPNNQNQREKQNNKQKESKKKIERTRVLKEIQNNCIIELKKNSLGPYNELMVYLTIPQVRDKIFDILRQ